MSIGASASASKSKTSSSRELNLTETISKMSEGGRGALDALIGLLEGKQQTDLIAEARVKNEGLTKEQAIKDSAAAVQNIMKSSAEDLFPKLYDAQQGGGSYNATTSQLITDNAQAEAALKAGALQQDTVQKYEQLANQNLQTAIAGQSSQVEQLIATLGLDAESQLNRALAETEKGTSKTSSKSVGISASYGF